MGIPDTLITDCGGRSAVYSCDYAPTKYDTDSIRTGVCGAHTLCTSSYDHGPNTYRRDDDVGRRLTSLTINLSSWSKRSKLDDDTSCIVPAGYLELTAYTGSGPLTTTSSLRESKLNGSRVVGARQVNKRAKIKNIQNNIIKKEQIIVARAK